MLDGEATRFGKLLAPVWLIYLRLTVSELARNSDTFWQVLWRGLRPSRRS